MAFGANTEVLQAVRPYVYHAPLTTVTGSDVTTSAFNGTTRLLRVYATEDCKIVYNATAGGAAYMPLPGGLVEFLEVLSNDILNIRADTTVGEFHYTEVR